jgi:hypothetical protein
MMERATWNERGGAACPVLAPGTVSIHRSEAEMRRAVGVIVTVGSVGAPLLYRALAAALVVGMVSGGGCRDDGLTRHRIRGTVTYQGRPVRSGAIFFEPTASVGQLAPTVYLPIRDGQYDTGSQGPVAGKYQVIVGGFDESKKRVDSDGVTHTELLFPNYILEIEVPVPGGRLDIEVPASKAAPPRG